MMTRYLSITLMLLASTMFTMGCGGGGGDEAGGDNTGQDTTGTPAADEPTGDPKGGPGDSTAADGPSLDIAIPGDDSSAGEDDGSESEAKKPVSEAIFNSIFRGATGGAGD